MSRYPARRSDSGGRSTVFGTRGAVACEPPLPKNAPHAPSSRYKNHLLHCLPDVKVVRTGTHWHITNTAR